MIPRGKRRKAIPRGKVNWRERLSGPIRPTLLEIVDSHEFFSPKGPEPNGRVAPYLCSVRVGDRAARDWARALKPAIFLLS